MGGDATAIEIEGPIAGDPFLAIGPLSPSAGYRSDEFFLRGSAQAYAMADERTEDGRWAAEPAERADFTTRVVVRRPQDPTRFNGTVVVEWLNVSGGIDAAPDYLFLHRHLIREGAAWIGVSAQKAGIDGGGLVPGLPLKQANAERYATLEHPGDRFAFDIFTAVGRTARQCGSGLLGPLSVERVIAVGESQSAGFLVTYVNAVDPLVGCFDGFLIHGRPGTAASLDGRYVRAAPDGDVQDVAAVMRDGHRVREDLRAPVLVFQSETDVVALGGGRARQPDSNRFRLWELAGASHFDTYGLIASHVDREGESLAEVATQMAPTDRPLGMTADVPVNSGPQQHYVLNAALRHLDRWIEDGTPPPSAERLASPDAIGTELTRDDLGIAKGGIRTPWVEAPTALLSGDAPGGEGFLFLFGRTLPFDAATLARLYPGGAEDHQARFDRATDRAVADGFLLEADAVEIRALARLGQQPSGWKAASD